MTTDRALLDALRLARNRLQRLELDTQPGCSIDSYERGEWAAEATDAIKASESAEPPAHPTFMEKCAELIRLGNYEGLHVGIKITQLPITEKPKTQAQSAP